jgi:hypothetical protein
LVLLERLHAHVLVVFTTTIEGTTLVNLVLCSRICRLAATYARLQEAACNRELSVQEQKQEADIEQRIRRLCASLPCVNGQSIIPIFGGDPRGATVKLRMPDGRFDFDPADLIDPCPF